MIYKKAVSTLVGVMLLLLVVVTSFAVFNQWQTEFTTGFLIQTEEDLATEGSVSLQGFSDGSIYVRSSGDTSLQEIRLGSITCYENYSLSAGMNIINVSSCLNQVVGGETEIFLQSQKGSMISQNFYMESFSSCSLDGVVVYHDDSYVFYDAELVPFGSSCSSQSRTCNDGTLDGDSSYQYASCEVEEQDTQPDSFSFSNVDPASRSTYEYSNTVTPTGYDGPLEASVSGQGSPQISVNGGSWGTSRTMYEGDNLRVRLYSSGSSGVTRSATVSLGDTSTTWYVTTGSSCSLDGVTVEHEASYSFYDAELVPFGSSCSSQSRTCNDGELDGDSSYQYANCEVEEQDFFNFNDVINEDMTNYNLTEELSLQGWGGSEPVNATVTVESEVWVGSTSVNIPSFIIEELPEDSEINLINNGFIAGAGGDGGGYDGDEGDYDVDYLYDGQDGGTALYVDYPVNLENYNNINGGGGGGASAYAFYLDMGCDPAAQDMAVSGGGGAGYLYGEKGSVEGVYLGELGKDGTRTSGGSGTSGSISNICSSASAESGSGGGPGNIGSSGSWSGEGGGTSEPGNPGVAIDGSSKIEFIETGEINGPQIN